jgi:hypothetical protein
MRAGVKATTLSPNVEHFNGEDYLQLAEDSLIQSLRPGLAGLHWSAKCTVEWPYTL